MLLRFIKHPAFLASIAVHGAIAGASYCFSAFEGPPNRPALLLGVEMSDVSGSVELDAQPRASRHARHVGTARERRVADEVALGPMRAKREGEEGPRSERQPAKERPSSAPP